MKNLVWVFGIVVVLSVVFFGMFGVVPNVSAEMKEAVIPVSTYPEMREDMGNNLSNPGNRITISIFADGYLESQKEQFFSEAMGMIADAVKIEPMATFRAGIRFLYIFRPSNEEGSDCSTLGIYKDTYYEVDNCIDLVGNRTKILADLATLLNMST